MGQEELDRLAAAISDGIAICHKEVLTLDEAARYTGLKKSYLYKLTAAKEIPHYKPTGKNCFFRRTELEEWLLANPVATADELEAKAQAYCMAHPLRRFGTSSRPR